MFRTISRLTTIFLLTTVLAACTLPSFLPPIEFDTMLLPGTSVVTAEDVYLGATAGALEGPTLFGIDEVSEPLETGPFPNARPLGEFVRVAAEGDFETPATDPLLLGLPVPAGVDTERLALAVLVPAETVHIDTGDESEGETLPEPRDTWVLVDGRFDPDGRRLVTTLTDLPEADSPWCWWSRVPSDRRRSSCGVRASSDSSRSRSGSRRAASAFGSWAVRMSAPAPTGRS